MIQNGFGYLQTGPWMAIAPAVMIFLAVVGFNLLGDAIREVLDPYGGAAA
jgi:peptide/nickel transport system permease protein